MTKRQAIVFNLENPHQRGLYKWCAEQSTNFSGFVKDILYAHKTNNRQSITPTVDTDNSDAHLMGDLL